METHQQTRVNNTIKGVFKAVLVLSATVLLCLQSTKVFSQVGGVSIREGTQPPHQSAMLDVVSSNKGILLPRMSATQRDAISPETDGLTVFVTSPTNERGYWFWDANFALWRKLGVGDGLWKLSGGSVFRSHGAVGIGINNPNFALDVSGNIALNASNFFAFPNTTMPSIHFKYTGFLIGMSNVTFDDQISLKIAGNGNKLMPYYTYFDFTKKIKADGIYLTSDSTLKKDIVPISNALTDIQSIQGVTFRWKDVTKGNQLEMGLIADDFGLVFPDLILEDDNGIKNINYMALVSLLIEAVKEQQLEIEELQEKLLDPALTSPEKTTGERDAIASPVGGMLIFNSDVNKLQCFDPVSATWVDIQSQ